MRRASTLEQEVRQIDTAGQTYRLWLPEHLRQQQIELPDKRPSVFHLLTRLADERPHEAFGWALGLRQLLNAEIVRVSRALSRDSNNLIATTELEFLQSELRHVQTFLLGFRSAIQWLREKEDFR